jgi:hypothetical protein
MAKFLKNVRIYRLKHVLTSVADESTPRSDAQLDGIMNSVEPQMVAKAA